MTAQQQSFAGAAVATTATSNIGSTDTTIQVAATTGWPDTSNGPFAVTLDRGLSSEEKILVSSYTSTELTVSTRGYDGTTAQTHTTGCVVEHTIDAAWHADVSAKLYSGTSPRQAADIVTTKGDIVVASGATALARLGVGTDTYVLTADSTATDGIKWGAPATGNVSLADSGTEVAISATSTWQTIATITPSATTLYRVIAAAVVPTGGADLGVQVTYADATGAQTLSILSVQSQAAGPWSSLPALIPAHSGTAVNVQVQSGSTSTTASAAIEAL